MIRHRFTSIACAVAAVTVSASAQQQPRVADITVAHNVAWGQPVDPATEFTPEAGEIFVWARLENAAAGTAIRCEWFFAGATSLMSIGNATSTVAADKPSIYFSYVLPAGRPWPQGAYRVELSANGRLLGEAKFTVAASARHYTHPRVGYSLAPPAGWVLEDASTGDGVRLRLENGTGLIEISSGVTGVRLDPVSYATGWESMALGPGRFLTVKQSGKVSTAAGEKSYEAVYGGAGTTCKFVFVASSDRMFVVMGSFAAEDFAAGEKVFDQLIQSLALLTRGGSLEPLSAAQVPVGAAIRPRLGS